MCFPKTLLLNWCPAISVVNCQKKMEVLSSDSSNNFQLPENFEEVVLLAPSNVSTLRHLHYPGKEERTRKCSTKKRGPAAH